MQEPFFTTVTGYNLLVIGYRLLQILYFMENDVSSDHDSFVCCIIQIVTSGRVIPYKYHLLSLVIKLISKLIWHMFICHQIKHSQVTHVWFESEPRFLPCDIFQLLCGMSIQQINGCGDDFSQKFFRQVIYL